MLKTIEKSGLRWYYEEGHKDKLYPSVSTVVGWKDKLFGRWKGYKTGNMAKCGTGIHFQIEKHILDNYGVGNADNLNWPDIDIYMNEDDRRFKLDNSLRMWLKFLKDYPSFKPIAVETQLMRPGKRGFAGRIDQYNSIENELWLLDLKTGKEWESYDLSLAGYYILLSEIVQVDKVVALYLDANIERNPSMNYRLKVYSSMELEHNVYRFEECIDEYYESNIIKMIFSNSYD